MIHASFCPCGDPELPPGAYVCTCGAELLARVVNYLPANSMGLGPGTGRAVAIAPANEPDPTAKIYASRATERCVKWWLGEAPPTFADVVACFTQRPEGAIQHTALCAPAPKHCGYVELQMRTEWPTPAPYGNARLRRTASGHADYMATYGARFKAETLDPALTHYARNMREWPVCNHGGKVEVIHNGGGRRKDGAEFATFGLRCNACRYRLMPNIDKG